VKLADALVVVITVEMVAYLWRVTHTIWHRRPPVIYDDLSGRWRAQRRLEKTRLKQPIRRHLRAVDDLAS
jgi:hypothetical protein